MERSKVFWKKNAENGLENMLWVEFGKTDREYRGVAGASAQFELGFDSAVVHMMYWCTLPKRNSFETSLAGHRTNFRRLPRGKKNSPPPLWIFTA